MLTIRNLTAGYGKLTILRDVDLVVQTGQFAALLGPNGSGKSTLLKSIYGLATVTAGSITLDGVEILGLPTERVSRQGLAYVPQRANVFARLNVRDNLQLAVRHQPRGEGDRLLQAAYNLFPILIRRQNQRAGQLSGGERQMLAIALGWLTQPRVMLLDEPSAGLSPLFVTQVFQTLQTLCQQGITLLVVEQNARSILRWCDYAFVLREGQMTFQGAAADILADPETVKSYLGVTRRERAAAAHTD